MCQLADTRVAMFPFTSTSSCTGSRLRYYEVTRKTVVIHSPTSRDREYIPLRTCEVICFHFFFPRINHGLHLLAITVHHIFFFTPEVVSRAITNQACRLLSVVIAYFSCVCFSLDPSFLLCLFFFTFLNVRNQSVN